MRVWPPLLLLLLGVTLSCWTRPRAGQAGAPQERPAHTGETSTSPHPEVPHTGGGAADLSETTRKEHVQNPKRPTCRPCECRRDARVVDCSGRHLTSVPPSLPANMTSLDFSNNSLDLKDDTFRRFQQLRQLDVSDNGIQNISTAAFRGLDNLEELSLDRNKLTYTSDVFKPEIFDPLQQLRRLSLRGNTAAMSEDLDYPDLALSRLPLLEELRLDGLTNRTFGPGFRQLRNLTVLSLSGHSCVGAFCKLCSISNGTFVNVPTLKEIDMSSCSLDFIDSGAFLDLKQIHTLDISMNPYLGFDNLERASYGFQNRTMKLLKASFLYSPDDFYCVFVKQKHFQYLRHVEEFHINYNMIATFEQGALLHIAKNIRVIYAQGNLFVLGEFLLETLAMKKLHTVDFSYAWTMHEHRTDSLVHATKCTTPIQKDHNELSCQNRPVNTTRSSYLDFLRTFSGFGTKIPVPENLRVIRVRFRGLVGYLRKTTFSANQIEEIDLSGNLFQSWVGPVYGLNKLKLLNLSRNYANVLKPAFTTSARNIEVFDASYNLLADEVVREENLHLLANLTYLRSLNFSHNSLYSLAKQSLQGLEALEEIRLNNNRLTATGLQVDWRPLKNLSYLDVSSNSLDRLAPHTISALEELVEAKSVRVDLRNNPLSCVCGNLDFLLWLRSTRVVLVSREELTCLKEDGSTANVWLTLEELDSRCRERVGLFMGSVLGSLAIVVVLVGLIIYRYRWKLRYLYYSGRERYLRAEDAQVQFRYDAFISYASEDYEWVRGELQQRLEGEHGLRLCVHQRDFLPGRPIASNVLEAVQTSRRTVCVLTQDFLDSYWCTYEMQMAKMEGLQSGRDVVLLLLYDHLIAHALPREILYYIQCESYLEYPQNQDALDTFWNNLVLALQRP